MKRARSSSPLFLLISTLLVGLLGYHAGALAGTSAPAAPTDSIPSDSGHVVPGVPVPYYLLNSFPCVSDTVVLMVTGYVATPCDSFVGATIDDPHHVTIRHRFRSDLYCFAGPMQFYTVPLRLGLFPAGPQSVAVVTENAYVDAAGHGTVSSQQELLALDVRAACDSIPPPGPPPPGPPPPPPVPGPLPYVDRIDLSPLAPLFGPASMVCPGESITVSVTGHFPNDCFRFKRIQLLPNPSASPVPQPPVVLIVVDDYACVAKMCLQTPVEWKASIQLPPLPPNLDTQLRVELAHVSCSDSVLPGQLSATVLPFGVAARCDSQPIPPPPGPPPPGPLPYVQRIEIGSSLGPCRPMGLVCPAESIQVSMAGALPNNCLALKRVEIVTRPTADLRPAPPLLRVVFGPSCCLCERPCIDAWVPWGTVLALPPLPPGSYTLPVEAVQFGCGDSTTTLLGSTEVPFQVQDSCPSPPSAGLCLIGRFLHPVAVAPVTGGPTAESCDAHVSPGHSGEITFGVFSKAALSGLQGSLSLNPPGLRVQDIEAIGAASGIHLSWQPTPAGAHFVLFAEHGAPVPAADSTVVWAVPLLRVTLEQPAGVGVPERTWVQATGLLGSDSLGRAVPECAPPPCLLIAIRPDMAVVCAGQESCDFNGDGHADIRDLVQMVHCVNGEGPCPDSAAARFDCDGNHRFDLDDVLCCASSLLLDGDCPGCTTGPPDSTGGGGGGRVDPSVQLHFGAPARTPAGVDLPVELAGAERLGAVRLVLSYPLSRFEVHAVELSPAARPDWLSLFQADGGRLRIGLIRTGHTSGQVASGGAQAVGLTLHLALKPGQEPGGEVSAEQAQFSATDGTALTGSVDPNSPSLLGTLRMSLSGNQPNPFSSQTRFSLTLDRAADLEVAVYNVSGRKVASLFHGRMEAGSRDFQWNGQAGDGTFQPNGIYFYRATSQGRLISHKMTLLRRD